MSDWEKVSMPVTRPQYVDDAVSGLRDQDEQHHVDPNAHCINPKCGYYFTRSDEERLFNTGSVECPRCGTVTKMPEDPTLGWSPGGKTRASIGLTEMGNIAEELISDAGALGDLGIEKVFVGELNPIDAILVGPDGTRYGCEIKANHSQAQERFKLGGRKERQRKIDFCYAHGLKPALIGVRLNFFDDRADVFFREGLTDTWIGNAKMRHLAQINFDHLNPFQTPEQFESLKDNPPADQSAEAFNAQMDELFGTPSQLDAIRMQRAGSMLKTAERDPDYIFIWYMDNLRIEPWHHNRSYADMVEELLKEQDTTIPSFANDLDPHDVSAGDVYDYGDKGFYLDTKSLSRPEANEQAMYAVHRWLQNQTGDSEADDQGQGQSEGQAPSEEAGGEAEASRDAQGRFT